MTASVFRQRSRELLRGHILDAATELAVQSGWDKVRMQDIADSVGVSRRTVFNEFRTKRGIAEAIGWRNVTRVMDRVTDALHSRPDDPVAAVAAAVREALDFADRDALVRAVMTGDVTEFGDLVALGTTGIGPMLSAMTEILVAHILDLWPGLAPDADVRFLANSGIRLLYTHITAPEPTLPRAELAERIADLVFSGVMSDRRR